MISLPSTRYVRLLLMNIGSPIARMGELCFEFAIFMLTAFLGIIPSLKSPGVIAEKFHAYILRTWPLVAITSFATGAALALQFGQGMSRFGGKLYVPNVVAIAIVKALGPVFACLMVAARCGGGIASELGSMKVTQQIDALKALGGEPIEKLVTPTLIALAIGVPLLTVISNLSGIVGGLAAATLSLGIGPELYVQKTIDSLKFNDLIIGIVKTSFFGVMIGLVASFLGFRTKTGTTGIGISTTAAIVAANIFVLLADLVVTKALWILKW